MRVKPGCGYWDVTSYPLGGCFRRAGDSGLEIVSIESTFRREKGADTIGKTADGRRVAFGSDNTDAGHGE